MSRTFKFAILLLIVGFFIFAGTAASGNSLFDPKIEIGLREQMMRVMPFFQMDAARSFDRYSAMAERFAYLSEKSGDKSSNPIDIVYTHVDFDADEAAGTIDTVTTVTIEALENNVTQVDFYLIPLEQFGVEDADENVLDYEYNEYWGTVRVTLQATLNDGEQEVLVFYNSGELDCEPDDYFGMTFCQVSEEIVFDASPYWIPTKFAETYEDLYTSGQMDFDITTPPDYVAATTSDLDSVEDLGDRLVHHFVGHFAADFAAMAYAKFDRFEAETTKSKPVKTYIHTGTTEFGDDWAQICADIINYFSDIYTPYLYNKQDVIQTIEELGGGVGPMSATFYYASALNASPSDWYSESIYSHEIGHSWWGNMIRLGDVYSPWLNEGFAEYSSRLYGYNVWPKRYQDYLYQWYFYYFMFYVDPEDEVPMSGSEIYTNDFNVYYMTTYLKGSHLIRMLQWLLGDEAFFEAMHNYAEDYVWENSHELVYVDDFQEAMEAASGLDLDSFFDVWVYSTGYPIYRWAAEFGQNEEGYTAKVRIEQVQQSETIYDIPIEVGVWVGEEDDDDDDEPLYFRVDFSGKVAEETFVLDEKPRGIEVDGSFWIWGDKIPVLSGDVNSSNDVDGIDLIYVAWAQGSSLLDYSHYWNYLIEADFNRDGNVDDKDLTMLLDNFAKEGKIND